MTRDDIINKYSKDEQALMNYFLEYGGSRDKFIKKFNAQFPNSQFTAEEFSADVSRIRGANDAMNVIRTMFVRSCYSVEELEIKLFNYKQEYKDWNDVSEEISAFEKKLDEEKESIEKKYTYHKLKKNFNDLLEKCEDSEDVKKIYEEIQRAKQKYQDNEELNLYLCNYEIELKKRDSMPLIQKLIFKYKHLPEDKKSIVIAILAIVPLLVIAIIAAIIS